MFALHNLSRSLSLAGSKFLLCSFLVIILPPIYVGYHLMFTNSIKTVIVKQNWLNFHHYWQTLHRWEPLVYNTLVEHYLQVWSRLSDAATRVQWEQRVVRLLESPEAKYDRHQTLILCQAVNFRPGVLYLYEENKL